MAATAGRHGLAVLVRPARCAGAGAHDQRDRDEVRRAERLVQDDKPGQRGDRRLEAHQHAEDVRRIRRSASVSNV